MLELIYGYNKLRQRRGGFASPVHALIGGIDPTFGFGPCPLRTTYKMRRSYPLGVTHVRVSTRLLLTADPERVLKGIRRPPPPPATSRSVSAASFVSATSPADALPPDDLLTAGDAKVEPGAILLMDQDNHG